MILKPRFGDLRLTANRFCLRLRAISLFKAKKATKCRFRTRLTVAAVKTAFWAKFKGMHDTQKDNPTCATNKLRYAKTLAARRVAEFSRYTAKI